MGGFSSKPPVIDEADYVTKPSEAEEKAMMERTLNWYLYSEALEPLKIKLEPKRSPYSVGRSSSNDIVVSSSLASKLHLQLVWQPDHSRWACMDLKSSGGTKIHYAGRSKKYIDCEEGKQVPLPSCCAIQLGKEFLCLRSNAVPNSMVLECVDGVNKGKTWPLAGNKFTCGRNEKNNAAVTQSTIVSSYHFEVKRHVGWFRVLDLDTRNGTMLCGTRLEDDAIYFLWPGAKIKIGFKVKDSPVEPDVSSFVCRMKYKNCDP